MHWVIFDDPHMDQGTRQLIEILQHADIPHSLHKVVPFIGELQPDIDLGEPTIVIGTYSMRHVARKKGWWPGSFDLAALTYADHVENWGDHMLNGDAVYCTFEDALDQFDRHGREQPLFIRPVVDSKFFAGTTMTYDEFQPWHEKVVVLEEDDGSSLRGSTEVMISHARDIIAEYRVWIVDGKVITASLYKRGGRVLYDAAVEDDILRYAQKRADEWRPHDAYVMDVARVPSGLKIIETNTMNAAGFYHGDVAKIVGALEEFVHKRQAAL